MKDMKIIDAYEGNLKHIDVTIPRNQLVVLTGVSGSGKSTLARQVIYQECQRQYLEAMNYQGIQKPKVERIENTSPAIMIDQEQMRKNPRSSVGTVTDIYTDLRMIFEKLAPYECLHCKHHFTADQAKEEVIKHHDDFEVFLYCPKCGKQMKKLTRTDFSFNTKEGACPECQGMGIKIEPNLKAILDETRCLEGGAVRFWEHRYGEYATNVFLHACECADISTTAKVIVKAYTDDQRILLLYGSDDPRLASHYKNQKAPKHAKDGKFEGILTTLLRRYHEKQGEYRDRDKWFISVPCPSCHGERLNPKVTRIEIQGMRLPILTQLSLEELLVWIHNLQDALTVNRFALIESYVLDIATKLQRIIKVGLGYLSLDRQTLTLSKGEAQRLRLAAALDSGITGIIYLLDEPTCGLHPHDTAGMLELLKKLRDMGNTVVMIEHDEEVVKVADYIIDLGLKSGNQGGEVVSCGKYEELLKNERSITARYLRKEATKLCGATIEMGNGIIIKNATLHNLNHVNVTIPTHALTTVTGLSGSGKSTLIFDVLGKQVHGEISGLDQFDQIMIIDQNPLTRMKRSNVATYSGVYSLIRSRYAAMPDAKAKGFTADDFSFNTGKGRCPHCEGLGYVVSNMLFFEDIEVVCPSCHGRQFNEDVLAVTYLGKSIHDLLKSTVDEAALLFENDKSILKYLSLLQSVGLGYLGLGQSLTTLSGGEAQRLKLAKELLKQKGKHNLYLLDEPTTGLHPADVDHFLILLKKLVNQGHTVIVVEHNTQLIKESDWIIDMGPQGGIHGGQIIAQGTPIQIQQTNSSYTGRYL